LRPDQFSKAEQAVLDQVASMARNVAALGQWGAGYDIATTTNAKSNPSSLTLMQGKGMERWAKLIVRWKTANPYFAQRLLEVALQALKDGGAQLVGLHIDGSNERHFASKLKAEITICPVTLIVSGEVVEVADAGTVDSEGRVLQVSMRQKEKLGNQLVNHGTDRLLALPPGKWLKDDFLLVKKEKGMFVATLDTAGNHADTFDSTKLADNALEVSGAVEAWFPQTGDLPVPGVTREGQNGRRNQSYEDAILYA
jgi:hypothetical protein